MPNGDPQPAIDPKVVKRLKASRPRRVPGGAADRPGGPGAVAPAAVGPAPRSGDPAGPGRGALVAALHRIVQG